MAAGFDASAGHMQQLRQLQQQQLQESRAIGREGLNFMEGSAASLRSLLQKQEATEVSTAEQIQVVASIVRAEAAQTRDSLTPAPARGASPAASPASVPSAPRAPAAAALPPVPEEDEETAPTPRRRMSKACRRSDPTPAQRRCAAEAPCSSHPSSLSLAQRGYATPTVASMARASSTPLAALAAAAANKKARI